MLCVVPAAPVNAMKLPSRDHAGWRMLVRLAMELVRLVSPVPSGLITNRSERPSTMPVKRIFVPSGLHFGSCSTPPVRVSQRMFMPLRFTMYRSCWGSPVVGLVCETANTSWVPSGEGDGSRDTFPALIFTGASDVFKVDRTKISDSLPSQRL